MPGHGSPSTGTGWSGTGPFFGYRPFADGWNSHVAKLVRRQCAASSPSHPPRMYPEIGDRPLDLGLGRHVHHLGMVERGGHRSGGDLGTPRDANGAADATLN